MHKFCRFIGLSIFLIILGCGYKPILKNYNYDFSINIRTTSGNSEVNKEIINKLVTLNGQNKFELDLSSIQKKNIISKDSKGDPNILEIIIETNYRIYSNDQKLKINKNLSKRSTYNNISDKFELKNFEDIIIKNLSNSIAEEIISSISSL